MNAFKFMAMKKYHILFTVFSFMTLYFLSSCCKDGDCKKDYRDKYVGTYITKVTVVYNGYSFYTHDTIFTDSIVYQEISKYKDSLLSIKYELLGLNHDTVHCEESTSCYSSKALCLYRWNHFDWDDHISGYIYGIDLHFEKLKNVPPVDRAPAYTYYFHGIKQ